MIALWLLAAAILGSTLLFVIFVISDARAAFDHDPSTHTASELIKRWRRAHGVFGLLALLAPLALLAGGVELLAAWLFVHLVLELV